MKLFGYTGFSIPIIDHAINNNLTLAIISYSLTYSFNVILVLMVIIKRKLLNKELNGCICEEIKELARYNLK